MPSCTMYRTRAAAISMHLIHSILIFAVVAAALPSSTQDLNQPQLIGVDGASMTSGQCLIGQHYCFSQIVGDLRVSKQDIIHQYCDQKSTDDWQSCNTCKRQPFPLPDCWDGPGVWSSVFECTDAEVYKWVGRCEGSGSVCSVGTCRWTTLNEAGKLVLSGNFTPTA